MKCLSLRIPLLICILLLIQFSPFAQKPRFEYGSSEELKGVTKIFISTDTETRARPNIIKEINKKKRELSGLEIVERAEDAEVLLVYEATVSGRKVTGHGYAAKPMGENRLRILLDFDDRRASLLERRPSTNFARAFIKAYLKANQSNPQ